VSRERNILRRSSISLALTSTIISARAQAARRDHVKVYYSVNHCSSTQK